MRVMTGLIEVKPQWKLDYYGHERAKVEAARQYASRNRMNFSLWTERELGFTTPKEILDHAQNLRRSLQAV